MSFSSEVKDTLCTLTVKKRCCRRALLLGMLFAQYVPENRVLVFSTDNENIRALFSWLFRQMTSVTPQFEETGALPSAVGRPGGSSYAKLLAPPVETVNRSVEVLNACLTDMTPFLTCEACRFCLLRGLFLASGTVSSPDSKGYHLELLLKSERVRAMFAALLTELGLAPKQIIRRNSPALYFKNSENIEDFLLAIGAQNASFQMMDIGRFRKLRGEENRRVNCDTFNIARSTSAAAHQLRAIRLLAESGKIQLLPKELQITAQIRLEHPECSLPEIAAMHEPPLTKSGVNHRLQKILRFAKEHLL